MLHALLFGQVTPQAEVSFGNIKVFAYARTPWDDPELAGAAPAADPAAPGNAAPAPEQAGHPAAAQPAPFVPQPAVPISIVRRRAHFEMEEAQKLLQKEVGCPASLAITGLVRNSFATPGPCGHGVCRRSSQHAVRATHGFDDSSRRSDKRPVNSTAVDSFAHMALIIWQDMYEQFQAQGGGTQAALKQEWHRGLCAP